MNIREKWLSDQEKLAVDAFKEHEIAKESEGRWLIRKPGTGVFWTEVICTHHGGLYVDGDIDPIVFRYGPEHPLARVRWMGHRSHAWDGYFREKACIGMGGRGSDDVLHRFERKVAIHDLDVDIAEELGEEGMPGLTNKSMEIIKRVKGLMAITHELGSSEEYDRRDMLRDLYELDLWEDCDRIGRVPSYRMFYVHAALQRLFHLLTERGDYN